jgi:bacterioferritin
MDFVRSVEEIRARARQQIENGPITKDYQLNREHAVGILNAALATEIVCILRYRFHYFMASGIHSEAVKEGFREHAVEEEEHAWMIAERIKQLGGKPEMNPSEVVLLSHSEYKEGNSLADMIREDLIAERIAIETYREMIKYFGDQDPTSRVLMEKILAKEEEHADELTDMLFVVEPKTGEVSRRLYFKDEIAGASEAGKEVSSTAVEGEKTMTAKQ